MNDTSARPCDGLSVGDLLPAFRHVVSRTDIVRYAGAGGDFNPIHHDDEYARRAGFQSVFAMGLMHGSYLTRVLYDACGPLAVRRYRIRFTHPVFPGDQLTGGGVVEERQESGPDVVLVCRLFMKNQHGQDVLAGDADLLLGRGDATGGAK